MALFSHRNWNEWISEYAQSHHHPMNRRCHRVGIPMIAVSIVLLALSAVWHRLALGGVALFLGGWVLQFVGHAFEGKPPEFFKDWRFLLVGLRWWLKVGHKQEKR